MRTRLAAAALVLIASLWLGATPASAHPLGNFTLNRYARVEVSGPILRTYYVEDLAELAAFARRDEVRADRAAYEAKRAAQIADALTLMIDGTRATLRVTDTRLDQPPGQGGLKTLRLGIVFESDVPGAGGSGSSEHQVSIADANDVDRAGWREIVAVGRNGARITQSTVPSKDRSDELRHYPADLTGNPLDVRAGSFSFTPGDSQAATLPLVPPAAAVGKYGGALTDLVTQGAIGPLALLTTIGLALLLGASHALLPGHGKTVMAAYLIGTRGRKVDAVALGILVSLMHTASVLILGLVLYKASQSLAIERAYPALTALSGALAVALGLYLVAIRYRRYRQGRPVAVAHAHDDHQHDDHQHDGHQHDGHQHDGHHQQHGDDRHVHADDDHEHDQVGHDHHDHAAIDAHAEDPAGKAENGHHHGHDHGPGGHSHLPPEGVAPLSRRGLLVLAGSGGLVPSPTAVVVLVASFSLGRAGLGLGIVAAFSVGLAATLTAVGLALVLGRDVAERHLPPTALRVLPVLGGAGMIVLGLGLVAQGTGVL